MYWPNFQSGRIRIGSFLFFFSLSRIHQFSPGDFSFYSSPGIEYHYLFVRFHIKMKRINRANFREEQSLLDISRFCGIPDEFPPMWKEQTKKGPSNMPVRCLTFVIKGNQFSFNSSKHPTIASLLTISSVRRVGSRDTLEDGDSNCNREVIFTEALTLSLFKI